MSGIAPHPRQGLVAAWVAQMVGTVVLAVVVAAYVRARGAPFAGVDAHGLERYVFTAVLAAAVPALWFLRTYKGRLDADAAALRAHVGALDLFFGGEERWFIGATFITLAIRLSSRPFVRQTT